MSDAANLSQVDRVSLPERSMFVNTPVYRLDDGTVVFGLRQPVLRPANGDLSLPVKATTADRLDLISHQLYGQSDSWWAIADVAGIIDPLAGVTPGKILRVPSAARLPT